MTEPVTNYFEPVIIFGWKEGNTDCVLEREWFLENCGDKMDIYTTYIVDGNSSKEAVYGISCSLNCCGGIHLSSEETQYVIRAYNFVTQLFETLRLYEDDDMPVLGYYNAINGNFQSIHTEYIPGERTDMFIR
jgi:hypothetical protein